MHPHVRDIFTGMTVIVRRKSEFIMLGMNQLKDDTSLFKTTQKWVTSLLRAHHVHGFYTGDVHGLETSHVCS